MLQKDSLVKFIEKGYLNKIVESLILEVNDSVLSTYFKTENGLRGTVEMTDFELNDCEIGVYYPDRLLKMLSIMDSELDFEIKSKDSRVTSVKMKDKKGKTASYATTDLDLFDRPEKKKATVSEYEVKINLNTELIDDILKAKSVIDCEGINFIYEKEKLFIVFGHSSNNKDEIKFEVECENIDDIGNLAFSAKDLQAILSINSKKFKTGIIEINLRGLMRVFFEDDKTKSEYFLIKKVNNSEE